MEDAPNKVGRPSIYSQELADKICSLLAEGMSLRTICKGEDMPDKATIFRWFRENKEFCDQYARAKEASSEALNEELMDLGDEAISLAQEVDAKVSSAVVNAVKLKADNIKWYMSKQKPKKYGDKVDVTSGGNPIPILAHVPSNNGDKENSQPQ